jgi:hypothetical protein
MTGSDFNFGMGVTDWNMPYDYNPYYGSGCCNRVCFCTGRCSQSNASGFDLAAYLELHKKLDEILKAIKDANKTQT